jgi:hypothetical protein
LSVTCGKSVMGNDCICSCKSNYHAITTTTAPHHLLTSSYDPTFDLLTAVYIWQHDITEKLLKVALKTITITTINDEAGILGSGEVHDASVEAIPPLTIYWHLATTLHLIYWLLFNLNSISAMVTECIVGSVKYMVSDNIFPIIIIETRRAH